MDRNTRLHERITIASGSPWSLLRLLGWRELVALAAALALAVVFAVLAGVLFLLIFPVALAAGLVMRWLAGRKTPPLGRAGEVRVESFERAIEIRADEVEVLPPRRPPPRS
ncbi:MAG: hypothetical protein N2038_09535 [Geminicoccaceae bacterium]|nr:hypothetical protein [Geminicoccaceae bacterium]MDW8369396.1 hypothetical protein [Geminicoccaceae bacterium]